MPSEDSLALTIVLTILFVDEFQLFAAIQSSYSSSGTTISLVVGVFVNALVFSSVGTALAFLKSNSCKA